MTKSPATRRWCMNIVWVASPPQACTLFDTDGDRHAGSGLPVERVAGEFGFGLLIRQSPGMKTPADDGLVAIHRRLHEAPPAISGTTLPSNTAMVLDRTQMIIALGNSGTGKTHLALGLGLAACQKGL